jgi:hypothetical protein
MEINRNSKVKVLLLSMLFLASVQLAISKDIYVSPKGSDQAIGTIDKPFATIERARDEVRLLIGSGLQEDINVILRGGKYALHNTLVLGLEDSPKSPYQVTYRNYQEESPVLSSGVEVTNWSKLDRLPPNASKKAEGHLWSAPIPDGIDNFRVMYNNGVMHQRAKGEKWSPVPPPPVSEVRQSDSRNVYYNKDRYRLRMIEYTGDELRAWENPSDIEVVFNPVLWNMMIIPLESVDTENKVGWLKFEANSQAGTKDPHHAPAFVYIENAIDFLDEPGEWCVNTMEGKIYYWPVDDEPGEDVTVPSLVELIKVEGIIQSDLAEDIPAGNIHFKGLTFTETDRASWFKNHKGWGIQHDWDTYDHSNAMLRFRGAENCSVEECHFVQGGGSAIRLDLHAQKIEIKNNLIEYVGHMGILLAGYGPGTKDVNKNNLIHNNILHHTGELVFHGHAIFVWQSGLNTISNNWIYDVPRKAIGICGVRSQILMKPWCNFDEASKTIRWNEIEATIDSTLSPQDRYFPFLHARENMICDNKITSTMLKLADGASLNISGAGAGNTIEHNFLYDLLYTGIRMDDWQDETYVRNNLVWNCKGGAYVFKGHNYLQNNIAVNVARAVHLRAFPQQTFKPDAVMRNNIFISDSEDFVVYKPAKWPATMNLHKAGAKLMPYEFDVDNNVYYYPGVDGFLKEQKSQGIEKNSLAMDPGFRDVENGDFRLKKNSPAIKLGFVPFETNPESFGVTDEYPTRFFEMGKQCTSDRAIAQELLHK